MCVLVIMYIKKTGINIYFNVQKPYVILKMFICISVQCVFINKWDFCKLLLIESCCILYRIYSAVITCEHFYNIFDFVIYVESFHFLYVCYIICGFSSRSYAVKCTRSLEQFRIYGETHFIHEDILV